MPHDKCNKHIRHNKSIGIFVFTVLHSFNILLSNEKTNISNIRTSDTVCIINFHKFYFTHQSSCDLYHKTTVKITSGSSFRGAKPCLASTVKSITWSWRPCCKNTLPLCQSQVINTTVMARIKEIVFSGKKGTKSPLKEKEEGSSLLF